MKPLAFREVKRKLQAAGFLEVGQTGSHIKFAKTTVEGFLGVDERRQPFGFAREPRRLAIVNQFLITEQKVFRFCTLRLRFFYVACGCGSFSRLEQYANIDWPKPQAAHARFCFRNHIESFYAHCFGFIQLTSLTSHLCQAAVALKARIEKSGGFGLLEILQRCLQRFVKSSAEGLQHSVVSLHQRRHPHFANRFRQRDSFRKLLLCRFKIPAVKRTQRRNKVSPGAPFARMQLLYNLKLMRCVFETLLILPFVHCVFAEKLIAYCLSKLNVMSNTKFYSPAGPAIGIVEKSRMLIASREIGVNIRNHRGCKR